jgi:UDP-N-acetyl-D-galactosamine dehydrogenase
MLFASHYKTFGYDTNIRRVKAIMSGIDETGQVDNKILKQNIKNGFRCSSNALKIQPSDVYIIAVPTPVDTANRPDLTPLKKASETVGRILKPGNTVIYESTVYPGLTEDICLPIIEKYSNLKRDKDFFAGYSPERVNPGDKVHTLENTVKITSGATPEAADFIDQLYNSVLSSGTHRASSIKVAEAAKIIENAQRDVNIAFMNEAAKIFNALNIDTHDIINASATKWNFINMKPGLVGGHCIGVDPYYLIEQAKAYGIAPRIMTTARNLNNSMGEYVAHRVIRLLNLKGCKVNNARILILGFTFKENCADSRNTKVIDIINVLSEYTSNIDVCDPVINRQETISEYKINLINSQPDKIEEHYDAIIHCVSHDAFQNINFRRLLNPNGIIYDVKGSLNRDMVEERL